LNARWLELLPLRFAAGGFLVEGAVACVSALAPPEHVAPYFGWRIAFLLGGALDVAIGIGILMRRRTWRVLGAFFAGLPAGVALAIIVVGYGPWGGLPASRGLVTALAQLGIGGFQLWVLTNPVAYRYCSK
jgi:hypothetical protein